MYVINNLLFYLLFMAEWRVCFGLFVFLYPCTHPVSRIIESTLQLSEPLVLLTPIYTVRRQKTQGMNFRKNSINFEDIAFSWVYTKLKILFFWDVTSYRFNDGEWAKSYLFTTLRSMRSHGVVISDLTQDCTRSGQSCNFYSHMSYTGTEWVQSV